MAIREERHQYIVLFRGDDSDFVGNQQIFLKLETELDLTECKAHFRFLDFKQDFDEIPADKTLELVFPKASTANFPIGAMDAELWLEDSTGKRRTVANRIHVVVTNSVKQAYDNDDPQAITVVITSGSAESISWNNITGKPSTFPPSAHTHPISQVDGLQAELNQRVNKVQNATTGNLASLTSDGGIQDSGESVASLKEYTNTQVATNTANFLGTYDYATDLGFTPPSTSADVDNDAIATALGGLTFAQTPTNNDYVFVSINYTPTTDVDEFRRFKFKGTTGTWAYEYTLNNSSFTAAQWAAINSGITSGAVEKLAGIAAGAQVNVIETVKVNGTALTPQDKAVDIPVPTLDNTVTRMSANGVKSSGIWSAIWGALSSLPVGFSSLYDWCVAQFTGKFAQYYPDGSVKSTTEFTQGIKYNTPDTVNRTITVKPFCNTGDSDNDNSSLVGRVVIPPFVDAQGNPYISDDGTRYKVVGVSGGIPNELNRNLTAIVAPTTVTNIGDSAIENCRSLTSVSFPAVTNIAYHAFNYCTSLTSVDFGDTPRSSVPTLGVNAFSGVPTSCKIIVPYTQYDEWKAADGWKDLQQEFVRHAEKADKPATFTAGNLAALDANGNPTDSTIPAANVAVKGEIPYSLGTPTVIDTASSETVEGETVYYGSALLANRTANIVQVTAATALDELRISFPAATSGKVRDFGLRVEIGTGSAALTAPALVPIAPTGETIKIENADRAIPELADGTATAKGVTLLYFSETAPGVFVVKGEQVEEVA